ncbi:MaoC/PaaZ C-terminal domain-containing protein [Kutzneria viridogrisea]|uniref:Acyl dehydratase n=1 Tax=Kutzneria viridogrisea TaxID=47990 RepID=A0ABR6BAN1_9PSEU|nr:acyl dehydratase [Kutzneria viridogrisea]
MPIDPNTAVGAALPSTEFAWTASDVLLYHLALGATELRYTYERDLCVLPTFALVAPTLHATEPPRVRFPGIEVDLAAALHGAQELLVHRPIPVTGQARSTGRIAEVQDKGSAAVIITEHETTDLAGDPLFTTRSSIFVRGEGGFGGPRGTSAPTAPPTGNPEHVLVTPTLPQQALLYRLCGDRNPLHVDPEFAATAGFPAPILHGLCTYGMVCKSIVDSILPGLRRFQARFAGVVLPGDTLRTALWPTESGVRFSTSVDDRVVLTGAAEG